MKTILLLATMLGTSVAFADTCALGTLQSYIDLAPGGCTLQGVLFEGFTTEPGQSFATPIDPSQVQVTPGGSVFLPSLLFTLGKTANANELFELFFRFTVSAPFLVGDTIELGPSTATGDGAVTATQDICPGGAFSDDTPSGCANAAATLITLTTASLSISSDTANFPATSFFDTFVDLTIDGGLSGSGHLDSVTVRIIATPEPGSATLILAALGALAVLRVRRSLYFGPGGSMHKLKNILAPALAVLIAALPGFAANHREAPITALDHKADITDVFAFRSYDAGVPRVTMILCVDPLQEPANGPNWWPFDPDLLYEIKIDNNNDAVEDIVFQFRFKTEQRLPNLFQVYAGAGTGISAPANSPAPVPPGTLIVPPKITSFSSPGLGQRQSYTVTMIKGGVATPITGSGSFFAVPANVGPRTIDYDAVFNAGTYTTLTPNVKVFAGTVDDPFWIDLGGAFDTLNTHIFPVLSPAQDAALQNFASDTVSGYSVNAIAIEVPVAMLTKTGAVEPVTSTAATIGVWGATSRPRLLVRRAPLPSQSSGSFSQIQRMGNPLINELLVGTGFKDRFSMDQPKNDSQFASFFLDPALARVVNALTAGAVAIPSPPRVDLLPVVTYAPPIAAAGTPSGPIADLLRLNTGVSPTVPASASRLGLLGGDPAGFPNGRRLFDDVTDVALRLVVGGVLAAPFPGYNASVNGRLGDGVNVNDAPYRTSFPYLGNAPSGRDRRHIDPGEPGCTAGTGPACSN